MRLAYGSVFASALVATSMCVSAFGCVPARLHVPALVPTWALFAVWTLLSIPCLALLVRSLCCQRGKGLGARWLDLDVCRLVLTLCRLSVTRTISVSLIWAQFRRGPWWCMASILEYIYICIYAYTYSNILLNIYIYTHIL